MRFCCDYRFCLLSSYLCLSGGLFVSIIFSGEGGGYPALCVRTCVLGCCELFIIIYKSEGQVCFKLWKLLKSASQKKERARSKINQSLLIKKEIEKMSSRQELNKMLTNDQNDRKYPKLTTKVTEGDWMIQMIKNDTKWSKITTRMPHNHQNRQQECWLGTYIYIHAYIYTYVCTKMTISVWF